MIRHLDRLVDSEKFTGQFDLSEWHTSLNHAPWTWIHPKQKCFDTWPCVSTEVGLMRSPRMNKWVVDRVDRLAELQ